MLGLSSLDVGNRDDAVEMFSEDETPDGVEMLSGDEIAGAGEDRNNGSLE